MLKRRGYAFCLSAFGPSPDSKMTYMGIFRADLGSQIYLGPSEIALEPILFKIVSMK